MRPKTLALESVSSEPTLLESIRNILVTYKGTVGSPLSLADVAKIARIEPITLISNDLVGVKELYTILHGVLNIYSAYYLQAVSILSAQLQDARILQILDRTNPDRDLKTLLTTSQTAYEDYKNIKTLSLENIKYKLPMLSNEAVGDLGEDKLTSSIHKLDTFEKLGVAVGKVIELRFTLRNGKETDEVTVPVVVKLDSMVVNNEVIKSILVTNTEEITFSSRISDVFKGKISFIKDFLFASDLIKNHKKTLFKDNTNTYNNMLKRINNSRIYSALSGNISLAGVSAIVVMSESDENEINRKLGGKLSSTKIRDLVFENTMAMMIVVVDKEWERVSIYIRDIDNFAQNPFSAFKNMSDKNNDSILDIFKAFSMGNAPSF